jgi:hypothetical protein
MFTRKFERRVYVAAGVFLLSCVIGVSFGAYVLWPSHLEAGYEPEQPLPYSHLLHAGELQIQCVYCHTEAERGAHATVPPLSTCMKCHEQVQTRDESGNLKPGLAILLDHWKSREPIAWNKVNDLADFVYFDHSRHLAANLQCQECHGPVETMERVRRQYGMKMSWCLDCHRQPLSEKDPAGVWERASQQERTCRGPIHCSTCHR